MAEVTLWAPQCGPLIARPAAPDGSVPFLSPPEALAVALQGTPFRVAIFGEGPSAAVVVSWDDPAVDAAGYRAIADTLLAVSGT